TDYTGELEVQLPLNITDTNNGVLQGDPATGETTLRLTVPCTGNDNPAVGSTCAVSTTVNAVTPGAVVSGDRSIWELKDLRVTDGGPDGVATTPDNTLFA